MKSMIRKVNDQGVRYEALAFICPGCASVSERSTGLHLLPVNTTNKKPAWEWDGNLEAPTLSPSILTGKGSSSICHSFLKNGVFNFLTDSTHALSGKEIPIPDLPDWFVNDHKQEED